MRSGRTNPPAGKSRANRHRGEVEAMIGGERRLLCLTLGALAELETAFAAESLAGLAERFSGGRLKAADLIRILGAGLRGGGNLFADEDVAVLDIDGGVPAAIAVVTDLLTLTFQPSPATAQEAEGKAPPPRP